MSICLLVTVLFLLDIYLPFECNECTLKKSPTSEYSSGSQDESYVIALIGKPSVGKSTIVRTGLNNLTPIRNVGADKSTLQGRFINSYLYFII